MSNYKHYTLDDWIQCINLKLEYFDELDGNEMRDLVEFLSGLPRWTPVSERLPEDRGYYLTTVKIEIHDLKPYYEIRVAQFDGKDFDLGYIGDGFSIIAWMPLPEPYKVEYEVVNLGNGVFEKRYKAESEKENE